MLFVSTSMLSNDFRFGKVSVEEVAQKEHHLEPESDAAILYKYRRTYFNYVPNSGFELVTEVHERIKIYNKEGFDWATKDVKLYISDKDETISGIKAYTYNLVNGEVEKTKLDRKEIIREETNKYYETVKFTMPAVKEGSVIEYEYKITSPYLSNISDTKIQFTIPVNKLEETIAIPEYIIFQKYFNPRSVIDIKLKEGSKFFSHRDLKFTENTYDLELEDIPALKPEPFVDYIKNYAAFIKWELQMTNFPNSLVQNYSQTWENVTKSIYDDVGLKYEIARTNFFEKDIDALLEGVSAPLEKMGLIYNFVKTKVAWDGFVGFVPDKGIRKAYIDGKGNVADMNLLLITMLKYAGLDANPILASTPDNGIPLYPTRNGFNYLISGVTMGNQIYLMDASDYTAGIGQLPKRARNWRGRMLRSDGSSDWISLLPANQSVQRSSINLQYKDDKLVGSYYKHLDGLLAKNYRDERYSYSEDKLTEVVKDKLKGFEVEEISVDNLNTPGAKIKEEFKFSGQSGFEVIGDNIYLRPLLFETTRENPFKGDTRNYPVFFDFEKLLITDLNFFVPEGYEVVSLPENIAASLENNTAKFTYSVAHKGNFMRIRSHIEINQPLFSAADYESLKNFYSLIVEKQNETIVLGKISEDGTNQSTGSGR
ncbi:DUF3857 domain-containing protein [Christiangramia salexigens]|nr:DUF3857 domain-containing protein [Christiangramia salexigens]